MIGKLSMDVNATEAKIVNGQGIGPQYGHQGRNAQTEGNGNADKEQYDEVPEKEHDGVELLKKKDRELNRKTVKRTANKESVARMR